MSNVAPKPELSSVRGHEVRKVLLVTMIRREKLDARVQDLGNTSLLSKMCFEVLSDRVRVSLSPAPAAGRGRPPRTRVPTPIIPAYAPQKDAVPARRLMAASTPNRV